MHKYPLRRTSKSIWALPVLILIYMHLYYLYAQGNVAYSSSGDRIALTQIEQMIDGKYSILGHYDIQADNLTWKGLEKWHGNKVIQLIWKEKFE